MAKLFGTDGIRGVANVDLKPTLAYALGRATAHLLAAGRGPIIIGQDTRRSGDMLAAAIVAGVTSQGVDVHRAGVLPTPALAYLASTGPYAAGIVVSASHNPADDNGLKVLDERGLKLEDAVEDELDSFIWRVDELHSPTNAEVGRDIDVRALVANYVRHRCSLAARSPNDLHVVIDCANGAAFEVAPAIIAATGARVTTIFDHPDGVNINLACGATAPWALALKVAELGADLGIALDGDADRCVAVDEHGTVVDGDRLIGAIALDRLRRDALAARTVVVSVLSNGGLADAVQAAGGRIVRTPVGDKYILDGMIVSGAGLGGEKSGHVIVMEHTSSGDGLVTALEILGILGRRGRGLSELAAEIPLLPQQQRAVRVRHKDQWSADSVLAAAIADAERELSRHGRVLVRPSGTEAVLRVMVEGDDDVRVAALADSLAALANERLN
jgi:phosphoglucosamine mutase